MAQDILAQLFFLVEVFHHFQSFLNGVFFLKREDHPFSHHPRTHWGDGMVQNMYQRNASVLLAVHQFQVADGEFIQPHILFFCYSGDGGDMFDFLVFGFFQIIEDCTGCDDAMFQVFYPKAFEAVSSKMAREFFVSIVILEYPVFAMEGRVVVF